MNNGWELSGSKPRQIESTRMPYHYSGELDIYYFLRSPDIAAHCERIGHKFTPLEMAVVIAISNKSIDEKHEAWKWVIDRCPDTLVRDYNCFDACESLHDSLRERIKWEKERLAEFYTPQANIVYRPYLYQKQHDRGDDLGCYSTVEKSIDAIRNEWDDWDNSVHFTHARIYKDQIDSSEASDCVWLNMQNKVIKFSWYNYSRDALDDPSEIFIHIPLPFEKGDIVEFVGQPYVGACLLTDLPHWHKNYHAWVSGDKIADYTDMTAGVSFMDDDKHLHHTDGQLFLDELMFHTGELKGHDRFLRYLSDFIKGNEKNPESLLYAYDKIRAISEYEKDTSPLDYCFKLWTENTGGF